MEKQRKQRFFLRKIKKQLVSVGTIAMILGTQYGLPLTALANEEQQTGTVATGDGLPTVGDATIPPAVTTPASETKEQVKTEEAETPKQETKVEKKEATRPMPKVAPKIAKDKVASLKLDDDSKAGTQAVVAEGEYGPEGKKGTWTLDDQGTLTLDGGTLGSVNSPDGNYAPWKRTVTITDIKKVQFISPVKARDLLSMFAGHTAVTSFDFGPNGTYLDTSGADSLTRAFYECAGLTELDLSGFTSIPNLPTNEMFYGTNLKKLTLNKKFKLTGNERLATPNNHFWTDGSWVGTSLAELRDYHNSQTGDGAVTYELKAGQAGNYRPEDDRGTWMMDIEGNLTLSGGKLESVTSSSSSGTVAPWVEQGISARDITSVNFAEKVTAGEDISNLFDSHLQLKRIHFGENFDTALTTNMSQLFAVCNALETVDVENLDTANVTNMEAMFSNCTNLPSVDVSGFNLGKVTKMKDMFAACQKMETLDLSSFKVGGLGTFGKIQMFSGMSALEKLTLPKEFVIFGNEDMDPPSGKFWTDGSWFGSSADELKTHHIAQTGDGPFTYELMTGQAGSYGPEDDRGTWMLSDGVLTLDGGTLETEAKRININGTTYGGLDWAPWVRLSDPNDLTSHNILDIENVVFKGKVTGGENLSGLFREHSNLESINFGDGVSGSFDTSSVTDMNEMFYRASSLTNLDLSSLNTESVKDMRRMFSEATGLTSLKLDGFDTSSVVNMGSMFSWTSSLTSLELGSFDTSAVTDMSSMFSGVSSLTSLELGSFDTSAVRDMSEMFSGASSLTSLDLSNFDTSAVRYMGDMFSGASSLTSLKLSDKFDLYYYNMKLRNPPTTHTWIASEASWAGGDAEALENYHNNRGADAGDVTYKIVAEDKTGQYGPAEDRGRWVLEDDGTLVLNGGVLETEPIAKISVNGIQYGSRNWAPWVSLSDSNDLKSHNILAIKNVVFKGKVTGGENLSGLFRAHSNLESINFGDGESDSFDTSSVTDMNEMFHTASSLTSLDLSSFDTESVKDMREMFSQATGLTSLKLDGFDTSSVVNMGWMFSWTSSLMSLDLSSFNTESVTDMNGMFYWASSLTSLKLSDKFNLYYSYMELDPPTTHTWIASEAAWAGGDAKALANYHNNRGADAGDVTYKIVAKDKTGQYGGPDAATTGRWVLEDDGTLVLNGGVLKSEEKTATVRVDSIDGKGITETDYFAPWVPSSDEDDSVDWQSVVENVVFENPVKAGKNIRGLFSYHRALTTLSFSDSDEIYFDTSDAEDMSRLFYGTTALDSLNIKTMDTRKVTNMSRMFAAMHLLTELEFGENFDTSKVTSMSGMFNSSTELEMLDLSGFNTTQVTDMSSMFCATYNLKKVDLSTFNTAKVKSMIQMFYSCRNLETLDLSNFDTRSIKTSDDLWAMFGGCDKLTSLKLGAKFKIPTEGSNSIRELWFPDATGNQLWASDDLDFAGVTSGPDLLAHHNGRLGDEKATFEYEKVAAHTVQFQYTDGRPALTQSIADGRNLSVPDQSGLSKPVVWYDKANGATDRKLFAFETPITGNITLYGDEIEPADLLDLAVKENTFTYDGTTKKLIVDEDFLESYAITLPASSIFSQTDAGTSAFEIIFEWDGHDHVSNMISLTVTPKPVDVVWNTPTREYDGTRTAPELTGTVQGIEVRDQDQVDAVIGTGGVYSQSDASDESLTISGITAGAIGGTRGGNYILKDDYTKTTTGKINPVAVEVVWGNIEKTYDGSTNIELTMEKAGVNNETIHVNRTAYFADKNASDVAVNLSRYADGEPTVTVTGGQENPANYQLTYPDAETLSGMINKAVATIAWEPITREYHPIDNHGDEATGFAVTGTLTGITGESVPVTATGKFADKTAEADKPVTLTNVEPAWNTTVLAKNYQVADSSGITGEITKKPLTLIWDIEPKVYDKSSGGVVINSCEVEGILGEDKVSHSSAEGEMTYSNVNVGKDIVITNRGFQLNGDDAENYSVADDQKNPKGEIVPRPLTNLNPTVSDKEYNGSNTAPISVAPGLTEANDVVSGDLGKVWINAISGSYLTPDVAYDDQQRPIAKPVTVTSFDLGGEMAKNYKVPTDLSMSGVVTPHAITSDDYRFVAGSETKTFDNSLRSNLQVALNQGDALFVEDGLALNVTDATYDSVTPGADKVITVNQWKLTGNEVGGVNKAANYTLPANPTTNGVISEANFDQETIDKIKELIKGTSVSKTYDQSTSHSFEVDIAEAFDGADAEVLLTVSGDFNSGRVEDADTFTVKSWVLKDAVYGEIPELAEADQFEVADATITPMSIEVTWQTDYSREYDGTVTAILAGDSEDFLSGDTVTITGTGTFANKNVGGNKAITMNKAVLSGVDAGNYQVGNYTQTASGTVTQKRLQATDIEFDEASKNKAFDTTRQSNLAASLKTGALQGEDEVVLAIADAVYDSDRIGDDLAISYTWSLTGEDAGNYRLPDKVEVTGAITPPNYEDYLAEIKEVIAEFDATVEYDGLTYREPSIDVANVFGNGNSSQQILIKVSGNFETKNVRNHGNFTVESWELEEADLGTLPLLDAPFALEKIGMRAKSVSPIWDAEYTREYDGSTLLEVETSGGIYNEAGVEDDAKFVGTGDFASKDVTGESESVNLYITIVGEDASNYAWDGYNNSVNAKIVPKELSMTWSAADKPYDGTDAAVVTLEEVDGLIDEETLDISGVGTFAGTDASDEDQVVTILPTVTDLGSALADNYHWGEGTAQAKINRRTLEDVDATVTGKNYDGTNAAAVTAPSLTTAHGLVEADQNDVSVVVSGTFDTPDVAYDSSMPPAPTEKPVTITNWTLAGERAHNYQLPELAEDYSAVITPKQIAASDITFDGKSKTFDDSKVSKLTATLNDGVILGDDGVVLAIQNATYDNKNIGADKTISYDWLLAGEPLKVGNYQLPEKPVVKGDITKPAIDEATVTKIKAKVAAAKAEKLYDGDVDHSFTVDISDVFATTRKRQAAVPILLEVTGKFNSKDVLTANEFTVTEWKLLNTAQGDLPELDGDITVADAKITPKAIGASWQADYSRVYDGTDVATLTGESTGILAGDDVTITGKGKFAQDGIGTNIEITEITLALSGDDAGNYDAREFATVAKGDITLRPLELTWHAETKTYDGDETATVSATVNNLVESEVLTFSGTGTFDTKDAGEGKTVTVTGITPSDSDIAENYSWPNTGTVTATINKRQVTPTLSPFEKEYDGTTAATDIVGNFETGVVGETITGTADGEFVSQDADAESAIAIEALEWSVNYGNHTKEDNYDLQLPAKHEGWIDPKLLTFTPQDYRRVYDGTTDANQIPVEVAGVVAGENVTATASGKFTDKHVGSEKEITDLKWQPQAEGTTKMSNYYYTMLSGMTHKGDITAKELTGVGASAADKVYNGKTDVVITPDMISEAHGMIAGDVLAVEASGAFVSKDAAEKIAVNVATWALTGADAGNYRLNEAPELAAAITSYQLTKDDLTPKGTDKDFDTGNGAPNLGFDLTGNLPFEEDEIGVVVTGATYDQAGWGEAIPINYGWRLAWADAGNYQLPDELIPVTGAIRQPNLRDKGDELEQLILDQKMAFDKVYDGHNRGEALIDITALFGPTRRMRSADKIELKVSGLFDEKNAGERQFTIGELAWSDESLDPSNLPALPTGVIQATISQKDAKVTWPENLSKVYDKKTDIGFAAVRFADDVLPGDEVTGVRAVGQFATEKAGANIAIENIRVAATGADAGNYNWLAGTASGAITKKTLHLPTISGGNLTRSLKPQAMPITVGPLNGVADGDEVGLRYTTPMISTAEQKQGRATRTLTFELTGADAENYALEDLAAEATVTIAASDIGDAFDELEELVEEIEDRNLKEELYSPETWQALEDALANAKKVLADPEVTVRELQAALTALDAAHKGLTLAATSGGSSTGTGTTNKPTGSTSTTSHSTIGKTGMVNGLGLSFVGVGTLMATIAGWKKRKK